MAKPIKVKCRYCKKEIIKSDAYSETKGMYYCDKSCFEQAQDKKKVEKNFKSTDGSERLILTDFIQSIYLNEGYNKSNIPWVVIGSQISNLLEKNPSWKYSTIKYILWYMIEIKGMNLFDGYNGTVLNLVEFYYQESKDYYMECEEIKREIEIFEFDDEVKIVKKNSENDKRYNVDVRF